MRQLILLTLAIPLVGCAQRAEMAPRTELPPRTRPTTEPVMLQYELTDQAPGRYNIKLDGETTTAYRQGELKADSEPRTAVRARFNTEMLVEQQTAPMGAAANETTTGLPPQSDASAETTETTPREAPSAGDADRLRLRQEIKQWNARVTLPNRQLPNEFRVEVRNGQLNIQAQGMQLEVPEKYRNQAKRILESPVIATVTDKGEVLRVFWPVPEQYQEQVGAKQMDVGQEGRMQFRAITESTGLLNLWFGMVRLPDEAVMVGKSWTAQDRIPIESGSTGPQFFLNRDARYTLRGVEESPSGPLAVIAVTEDLKLHRRGEGAESAANQKAQVVQTRNGTVYFNIDRGRLERSNQDFLVSWDTNFSLPRQATQRDVNTHGQAKGTMNLTRADGGAARMNERR